jgi:hypothetical protein
MKKLNKKYIVRERDSKTGRFVKEGTEKKRPSRTTVDRMRRKRR